MEGEVEKGCRDVEEDERGEGKGENKERRIWGFGKWKEKSGKGVVDVSMHFDTYRDQSSPIFPLSGVEDGLPFVLSTPLHIHRDRNSIKPSFDFSPSLSP